MEEFLEFFKRDEIIKEKSSVIPAGADLEKFAPINNTDEKSNCIYNFLNELDISMKKELVASNLEESSWKTDVDIIK